MKQHASEFDTSVAAEGFRQIQAANEHPFSQEQHDPWLEQFLASARKAFGFLVRKTGVAALAQELEQRGYFGFAHYADLRENSGNATKSSASCKRGELW